MDSADSEDNYSGVKTVHRKGRFDGKEMERITNGSQPHDKRHRLRRTDSKSSGDLITEEDVLVEEMEPKVHGAKYYSDDEPQSDRESKGKIITSSTLQNSKQNFETTEVLGEQEVCSTEFESPDSTKTGDFHHGERNYTKKSPLENIQEIPRDLDDQRYSLAHKDKGKVKVSWFSTDINAKYDFSKRASDSSGYTSSPGLNNSPDSCTGSRDRTSPDSNTKTKESTSPDSYTRTQESGTVSKSIFSTTSGSNRSSETPGKSGQGTEGSETYLSFTPENLKLHANIVFQRAQVIVCNFIQDLFVLTSLYNRVSRKFYRSRTAIEAERSRQRSLTAIYDRYLIHPYSILRWSWDFLLVFVMAVNLFAVPFNVAFLSEQIHPDGFVHPGERNPSKGRGHDAMRSFFDTVNVISDVFLLIDVVMNFRTGYLGEEGIKLVILNSQMVAKHYARTWFIIDFIGSLPISTATLSNRYGQEIMKTNKMFYRAINWLAMVRVVRLFRYVPKLEALGNVRRSSWRMFNIICLTIGAWHFCGCMEFTVVVYEGFPSGTWVMISNMRNKTISDIYVQAVFRSLSHMLSIGYGGYAPYSTAESVVTTFNMVIGTVLNALLIVNVTHVVAQKGAAENEYDYRVCEIKLFMKYHNLPLKLQRKVISYFEMKYNQIYFDKEVLLSETNPYLKTRLLVQTRRNMIGKACVFENAGEDIITNLAKRLEYDIYPKGETIISTGERSHKMFFIEHGRVDIVLPDGSVIFTLYDGHHFGEMGMLRDEPYLASFIAASTCVIYYLSRKDLIEAYAENPELKPMFEEMLEKTVDSRGKRLRKLLTSMEQIDLLSFNTQSVSQDVEEELARSKASVSILRKAIESHTNISSTNVANNEIVIARTRRLLNPPFRIETLADQNFSAILMVLEKSRSENLTWLDAKQRVISKLKGFKLFGSKPESKRDDAISQSGETEEKRKQHNVRWATPVTKYGEQNATREVEREETDLGVDEQEMKRQIGRLAKVMDPIDIYDPCQRVVSPEFLSSHGCDSESSVDSDWTLISDEEDGK